MTSSSEKPSSRLGAAGPPATEPYITARTTAAVRHIIKLIATADINSSGSSGRLTRSNWPADAKKQTKQNKRQSLRTQPRWTGENLPLPNSKDRLKVDLRRCLETHERDLSEYRTAPELRKVEKVPPTRAKKKTPKKRFQRNRRHLGIKSGKRREATANDQLLCHR